MAVDVFQRLQRVRQLTVAAGCLTAGFDFSDAYLQTRHVLVEPPLCGGMTLVTLFSIRVLEALASGGESKFSIFPWQRHDAFRQAFETSTSSLERLLLLRRNLRQPRSPIVSIARHWQSVPAFASA